MRLVLALILPCVLLAPFRPAAAGVCVTNGTDETQLFVAEVRGAERQSAWLATGDTICAEGQGSGVVSVYESEDVLEGCSRLVPDGGADRLERYADFDRCKWASHP